MYPRPEQGVQATSTLFGTIQVDVEHPKVAPRNMGRRQTTSTCMVSDTPGPFHKTQDDVDPYGLGTSHPLEESTFIKGPRTTDHPIAGIKNQPSYQ
ncbi:hypothetical protein C4D60_Mb08t09580 [Musa balbisiana]|uniref:Uncharacterized protein n=1 Tax=Musa balbisiana TaxID=52838 RepID=A0A4S8K2K5_MUSBA|nr:hypothetical protein C4D60_Mb08t09580 [Musa balbisiana]